MIPDSLRKALVGISPYFCFLLAIVTLGPLQFGFHLAELNAPQDVITCRRKDIAAPSGSATSLLAPPPSTALHRSLPDCIPMSEARFATVSSVYTIGGLIGALAAGPFCSRNGRRPAMAVTSFVFLVGSIVETFSASVPMLAVGRVLNGISAGASTVIVPLYISEVAPPASRGFFGAFTQITVNVGILFVQTLGFFLSHDAAWRFILGTGIVIALINLVGMWGVAESPAWLVTHKGESVRARSILQRIRGAGLSIADEVAAWPSSKLSGRQDGIDSTGAACTVPAEEQALLVPPVDEEGVYAIAPSSPRPFVSTATAPSSSVSVGFFKIVTDAHYRPAMIAVIGIMFAQQICGINSVIMYSVSLLDGMLPLNSALLTIIISGVNLVTTMLCAPLPDRLGRKPCLLVSVVGQGLSSLALAFSIVFGVKILSAFSVLTFVAFFAVGLGPVPFILASELVGQEAVGATQSWALGANYIATFLVAQFFPMINSALNARLGGAGWVYFLFAGCAALSAVFFWIYVPETKGKKDADEVWGRTTRLD